ncbi:hypothetical protein WA026_009127, partial [Henosepilachna vigintioctopunctata]
YIWIEYLVFVNRLGEIVNVSKNDLALGRFPFYPGTQNFGNIAHIILKKRGRPFTSSDGVAGVAKPMERLNIVFRHVDILNVEWNVPFKIEHERLETGNRAKAT